MATTHEHDGHRQRIIAKLDSNSLETHEYLEILLFNAIPRLNTNDLAHRLLSTFGSIEGVFEASVEQLQSVKGVGAQVAAYIRVVGKFIHRYVDRRLDSFYPKKYDSAEFKKFIPTLYEKETKEVFDCFLLDDRGFIRLRKRFTSDRETSVLIETNEFSKLLADNRPAGLIVVHNHLDFNCFPSPEDDRTTKQLQMIASIQNVLFMDHLICSRAGIYSYYDNNRMQEISKAYSVCSILDKDDGQYDPPPAFFDD